LIDVKKSRNNLYIFLEYCHEGTLAELIEAKGRMSEAEGMAIFAQIVKGMQVLAVNKVIHRDLKPTNILLNDGVVKIADFGLAKKFMNTELHQTFAGSPLQMAPEIMRGDSYTEKVDVYSAGSILYEMLYGKAPFDFLGRDFQILLKAKDRGIK
jgi:serine/threonine-protein kinase ULK2